MACYHPIPARNLAPEGAKCRLKIKVVPQLATHWIPCGTCVGCIEAQALHWTIRMSHESRFHSRSTFLTLTYDDANCPHGLQVRPMQTFWKRLRRAIPEKIRTFYCGEYGDRTKRPHYHAAVFGLNPIGDETRWDMDNDTSATLNKIWGNGLVTISELTPYRMAYVAGYVLKKAGYRKQKYLAMGEDGIAVEIHPPFRRMSQGIGKEWVTKYANDLREGCVQHDGYKVAIPRYYKERVKKAQPDLAAQIQAANDERRAEMPIPERARLDAAEKIRLQQIKSRKRERV